jgi:hypothetical protein
MGKYHAGRSTANPAGRILELASPSQAMAKADAKRCLVIGGLALGTLLAVACLSHAAKSPRAAQEKQHMEQNKMKIAYVITQRKDRNFWNRVGVAFVNSDGSINVKLEAVPVSGEIQIRDYQPREELAASSGRNPSRDLEEEPYAELA